MDVGGGGAWYVDDVDGVLQATVAAERAPGAALMIGDETEGFDAQRRVWADARAGAAQGAGIERQVDAPQTNVVKGRTQCLRCRFGGCGRNDMRNSV